MKYFITRGKIPKYWRKKKGKRQYINYGNYDQWIWIDKPRKARSCDDGRGNIQEQRLQTSANDDMIDNGFHCNKRSVHVYW